MTAEMNNAIYAMACALAMVDTVNAIDSIPERLAEAEKIGVIVIRLNYDSVFIITAATDGRGADVVMQNVGHADALLLSLDLIRPRGQINFLGVHTEKLELNGLNLYDKIVTMAFGRCSARLIFEAVLDLLIFWCSIKMKSRFFAERQCLWKTHLRPAKISSRERCIKLF